MQYFFKNSVRHTSVLYVRFFLSFLCGGTGLPRASELPRISLLCPTFTQSEYELKNSTVIMG